MSYSTTFAFLIFSLLGWLGVSHIISQGDIATIIDNVIQVVGIVGAAYGRYKAGGVTALGFRK